MRVVLKNVMSLTLDAVQEANTIGGKFVLKRTRKPFDLGHDDDDDTSPATGGPVEPPTQPTPVPPPVVTPPTAPTTPPADAGRMAKVAKAWFVDINPARPFGKPQGVIPDGAGDRAGKPNLVVAHCEAQFDPKGKDDEINIVPVDKGDVTPTEIKHHGGLAWVSRVPDPAGSGAMVYMHRLNRAAVGYVPGAAESDSIRAEVSGTGEARMARWGEAQFVCGGIFVPSSWRDIDLSKIDKPDPEWHVVWQWHDAAGGHTGNPTFAAYMTGGADAKFNFVLRRYKDGLTPPQSGNQKVAGATFNATPGVWHWFVAHCSPDAGPGFRGDTAGFFNLHYAAGDGPLKQIVTHDGVWGSPNSSPEHKDKAGYMKTGLYCRSNFSQTDDRIVFTRGVTQTLASAVPGMTAEEAYAAFRASRANTGA